MAFSRPIIDEVTSTLQASPFSEVRKIRFEAAADQLVLRGTVNSWFQKQMAQEALRNIPGLGPIENEIEVSCA